MTDYPVRITPFNSYHSKAPRKFNLHLMTYFMTFHLHQTKKQPTKITFNLPFYTQKLKLCYSRIHLKRGILCLHQSKKNLDTKITLNICHIHGKTEKLLFKNTLKKSNMVDIVYKCNLSCYIHVILNLIKFKLNLKLILFSCNQKNIFAS